MKPPKKAFKDKVWDKYHISWWCDWLQIKWKDYNWINFNFIGFNIEWDKMGNEFVVEMGLLGFNLRWQLSLSRWFDTEQNKDLMKRIKKVMKDINKEGKK